VDLAQLEKELTQLEVHLTQPQVDLSHDQVKNILTRQSTTSFIRSVFIHGV